MRITQGAELDLVSARLEAMRAAGASGEAVFSVPDEPEQEPAQASARRARDERDRDRDRGVERDHWVERPALAAAASVAVGGLAPPPAPADSAPVKLDREPGRSGVKGGERPGAAPAEGREGTDASGRSTGSTGSSGSSGSSGSTASPSAPASGAVGKAAPDRSTREPEVAAKVRAGDPLPLVDGAAPAKGVAPEAAASAARAPTEAVASAAAQAAVETVVTQAGASAAQAANAPGPKAATGEPALPGPRAGAKTPAASALPTVPGALPTVSQRQSDNGLTPVKASAPGAPLEGGDPLRARLQDALRSSINQRVMQESASGEVVLPGLGRVAVSARTADAAVAVEVHAAQAATARLLHASAGEIAADVIAADIPLSTLSFGSAGSWSQADPHAPPSERDWDPPGSTTDEMATAARPRAAVPAGRVRIVL